jgi:hypothetical protein
MCYMTWYITSYTPCYMTWYVSGNIEDSTSATHTKNTCNTFYATHKNTSYNISWHITWYVSCMLHNIIHNIVYTVSCCVTWEYLYCSSTVIPGISLAAGSGRSRSKAAIYSAIKPGKPSNIVANGSAPLPPPPPAPRAQSGKSLSSQSRSCHSESVQ